MSEGAADPVVQATARLEAAVERLIQALDRALDGPRPDADTVPRSEVAAMAERLDATIARLRLALAEDGRAGDPEREE
jgi:hypothetical protein